MSSNEYFDNADLSAFPKGQKARAESVDAKFDAVTVGLDKMPTVTENDAGTRNYSLAAGAANAYELTLAHVTAYSAGLSIQFRIDTGDDNTGASTLEIGTLGAAQIVYPDETAMIAGDLPAGSVAAVRYSSGLSKWVIQSVTQGNVAAAAASAVAADSSASAASGSASSASGSASAASGSASAASTSASNASTSEGNAGTSETNAANSASAADTSAGNASTSEGNASTSASAASGSASAASGSASAASTSEGNAATSETNAGNSASAASTSEGNAATSETNAGLSAAAAAISETNAAESSTNAAESVIAQGVGKHPYNFFLATETLHSSVLWSTTNATDPGSNTAQNPQGQNNSALLITATALGDISIQYDDTLPGGLGSGAKYCFGIFIQQLSGTSDGLDVTGDGGSTFDSFTITEEYQRFLSSRNIISETIEFVIKNASAGATFAVYGPSATEKFDIGVPYIANGTSFNTPELKATNLELNKLDGTIPIQQGNALATSAPSATTFTSAFIVKDTLDVGEVTDGDIVLLQVSLLGTKGVTPGQVALRLFNATSSTSSFDVAGTTAPINEHYAEASIVFRFLDFIMLEVLATGNLVIDLSVKSVGSDSSSAQIDSTVMSLHRNV